MFHTGGIYPKQGICRTGESGNKGVLCKQRMEYPLPNVLSYYRLRWQQRLAVHVSWVFTVVQAQPTTHLAEREKRRRDRNTETREIESDRDRESNDNRQGFLASANSYNSIWGLTIPCGPLLSNLIVFFGISWKYVPDSYLCLLGLSWKIWNLRRNWMNHFVPTRFLHSQEECKGRWGYTGGWGACIPRIDMCVRFDRPFVYIDGNMCRPGQRTKQKKRLLMFCNCSRVKTDIELIYTWKR